MNYKRAISALLAIALALFLFSFTTPFVNAGVYSTTKPMGDAGPKAPVTKPEKDGVDKIIDDDFIVVQPDELIKDETPNVEEPVTDDTIGENEKLYNLVDLWNFKPSHSMLVTQALVRVGAPHHVFTEWYEAETGIKVKEDNWSLAFLNWCVHQSNTTKFIPLFTNLQDLKSFFQENQRFYVDGAACLPKIGDLLLIDDDGDKVADRVNIVSYYERGTAVIESVGGSVLDETYGTYTVQEENFPLQDKAIVGVCRPDNGLKQDPTFSDPEIRFNGVDTVCYLRDPAYAYSLADAGIEVIARYINPDGRKPLDIEEAQRYSDAGVRIMMIYQINTNDPYKGYDTGYEFGTKALEYARNLQAPKGTPIFFCCDCACDMRRFDKVAQFIMGVKDAIGGEYGVGLYGGYYVNEAMYNLGLIDAHWQSLGFNDGYLSPNMDMFQSSSSTYWFSDIPIVFDSNYVKNPEKVSYIMPSTSEKEETIVTGINKIDIDSQLELLH